jgi:ribonucleoside-diphosphate reductase alpha chain
MDCDTTGIEPELALVKYKNLVGGGTMKIVNQTVPKALERLGYKEHEIKAIVAYLEEKNTIEGAPYLKNEHLPVFDCAFRPVGGNRCISVEGHVKMMAAVQPFLSGAISKTVNMPSDATIEDVERIFLMAWKLGLKAIAIYRDGSKKAQPVVIKPDKMAKEEKSDKWEPVRRKLPDERKSITHKFSIAGLDGYITVGMYEDGTPGEIFITIAKQGSVISGLMDCFATAVSIALQYGVPLRVLVEKFAHVRFEPSGYSSNPQIGYAKSIVDYIFRWLALKFLPEKINGSKDVDLEATLKNPEPVQVDLFHNQEDAPPCSVCGFIMVRSGSCYRCPNCGATSGCS